MNIKKLLEEQGLMFHEDGLTTRTVWLEDIEAAFAKALQGDSEPVYEYRHKEYRTPNGKKDFKWSTFIECDKAFYDFCNKSIHQGYYETRVLFTSPPNTQAMLDMAMEALKDICNEDIRQLRSAEAIAREALKELEK